MSSHPRGLVISFCIKPLNEYFTTNDVDFVIYQNSFFAFCILVFFHRSVAFAKSNRNGSRSSPQLLLHLRSITKTFCQILETQTNITQLSRFLFPAPSCRDTLTKCTKNVFLIRSVMSLVIITDMDPRWPMQWGLTSPLYFNENNHCMMYT